MGREDYRDGEKCREIDRQLSRPKRDGPRPTNSKAKESQAWKSKPPEDKRTAYRTQRCLKVAEARDRGEDTERHLRIGSHTQKEQPGSIHRAQ